MFEALFVSDETAIRRALGLKRRPKDWPTFDSDNPEPGRAVLQQAVRFAAPGVRRRIRGDMESNKHGWALHFIRSALADDALWRHPIADRLKMLLTP